MQAIEKVMWWLLANSLGGESRAKILLELLSSPQNANNLSKTLNLDYKTIRYHLGVLEENGLLTSVGKEYGKTYFPSDEFDQGKECFDGILDRLGMKLGKKMSISKKIKGAGKNGKK
jgi:DNA-binding transcriptional ArsR family regulator